VPPETYVVPAGRLLTELHRKDPAVLPVSAGPDLSDGTTVCGEPMLIADAWMPIERRASDRVCGGCGGPGKARDDDEQEAGLW
jgi:hypothetical protein